MINDHVVVEETIITLNINFSTSAKGLESSKYHIQKKINNTHTNNEPLFFYFMTFI